MQTSSQSHSFDVMLGAKYGIELAIVIHHFQHWIRINRRNNKNIIEGRCWTYQTRKDILAHYPYWTFDEIRRICEKLVNLGILITRKFNKSKIDNTLWYAFSDEKAFGVDEEFSNSFYERQNCLTRGRIASPIPNTINKDTKNNLPPLTPPSLPKKTKSEDEAFFKSKEGEGNSENVGLSKIVKKWESEKRPKEIIEKVIKIFNEQPMGSIRSISSWAERVFNQQSDESEWEILLDHRRKFAIKKSNEQPQNYNFNAKKDLLSYSSGAVTENYKIQYSEDFWEKNKLGRKQFLEWRSKMANKHV